MKDLIFIIAAIANIGQFLMLAFIEIKSFYKTRKDDKVQEKEGQ